MAVYAGDGDIVATGSTDNTLRLWDLRSHRCIDVVLVGDSSPASVALSINGSYLASGICNNPSYFLAIFHPGISR